MGSFGGKPLEGKRSMAITWIWERYSVPGLTAFIAAVPSYFQKETKAIISWQCLAAMLT